MKLDFNELVGEKAKLYGVDGHKFKLGSVVFEALENGYRSHLDFVAVVRDGSITGAHSVLAEVEIRPVSSDTFSGYALVDDSGHCWLRFGTDSNDSYYPHFVFEYVPKEYFIQSLKNAIKE